MQKAIPEMAYCNVVSRKGMKGSGLKVGDTVLVVGHKVVPIKQDDPYLQRILFMCILVDSDGLHHIPSSKDADAKNYLIDPRCLSMAEEVKQVEYKDALESQYATTN